MGLYRGITKKKMNDGSVAIMARFKHDSITYPVKNFTNLFGCKTEKEANLKLGEVKVLLSRGIDPFASSLDSLNAIFYEKLELNLKNHKWADSTVKTNKYFFDKHISPIIGKKKIEKIRYEEVMKIINSFKKEQSSSINTVIGILRPIFEEELKKGHILKNIMLDVKKAPVSIQRAELTKRTEVKTANIARKLYSAIPLYSQAKKSSIEQHQMFLYMLLLTAHRYGELNNLEKKHCNLETRKIIAPAKITKTNEDYHFPIPDECYEFIKNAPDGKLFNVPRGGTASRIFHRLLVKAEIETINNHSISMHDTRRLMLSIMIKDLKIDSRMADYCLEHKPQGTIKHYLNLDYDTKVECYNKYWDFLRSGKIPNEKLLNENEFKTEIKEKTVDKFEKLEKLVEMYEKKYITQEQFENQRNKLLD